MANCYEKLMDMLPMEEPSPSCSVHVMQRIEKSTITRLRMFTGLQAAIIIGSIGAAIPAVSYFISSVSQSGISDYASILVSDGSSLSSHWSDFLMSVASSMPVLGSIAVLALILVFVTSLRRLSKDVGSLETHRNRVGMRALA
jgi:flagellar biogenesis protein FliO